MCENYLNGIIENREKRGICPMCEEETTFVIAEECFCHIDFDGAGYTYNDEYGSCPRCDGNEAICLCCRGEFPGEEIWPGEEGL
ncbi:MAG: hypothetical protein PVG39_07920 [Desulfobacteraceae bacterium]|jgi:hypothetical protein